MKWSTVAPILAFGTESLPHEQLDIGNGVTLQRRPEWVDSDHILKPLSEFKRRKLREFPSAFVAEYEADAFGDKQEETHQKIILANLALWLAQPSGVSFALILDCKEENGIWNCMNSFSLDPVLEHDSLNKTQLSVEDINFAKTLSAGLVEREQSLKIACYFLWIALRQPDYPTRYILLWTAMEALFGPESPGRLTFKLSRRTAFFLSASKEAAEKMFKDVKKSYELRSILVHGKEPTKERASDEQILVLQDYLRQSLLKILTNPELLKVFSSGSREEFLNDLVHE